MTAHRSKHRRVGTKSDSAVIEQSSRNGHGPGIAVRERSGNRFEHPIREWTDGRLSADDDSGSARLADLADLSSPFKLTHYLAAIPANMVCS